jgi:hypothetical protein
MVRDKNLDQGSWSELKNRTMVLDKKKKKMHGLNLFSGPLYMVRKN